MTSFYQLQHCWWHTNFPSVLNDLWKFHITAFNNRKLTKILKCHMTENNACLNIFQLVSLYGNTKHHENAIQYFFLEGLQLWRIAPLYSHFFFFGIWHMQNISEYLTYMRGGGLRSLWLYKKNNKLWDWKNIFTLHIPPDLHTLMTSLF
jgi:hypothetical protein